MITKLPIFEAKIADTDDTGIFAMSFVDIPAVEKNFVALKKAQAVKLAFNKSRQILTGVVLIPDMLIYRNDPDRGEYYLRFKAADIERIANKMMRTGVSLSTTTHQHEAPLAGNYLTELWIVEDPKRDKAVALGLGELPKGTLCASYKVTDAKYWREEVLAGKVKGFSLEGLFNYTNVKMNKPKLTPAAAQAALGKKPTAVVSFLKSITAMLEGDTAADAKDLADVAKADEVDAGDPYLIFTLADGSEMQVDAEGFATIGGEQSPAGEHALADGNVIVIDDAGLLVITTDEADEVTPEAAAAALAKVNEAKERGKALLAAQKKDAAASPNAKKITALEVEIAKLKAEPSAAKATPKVAGVTDMSTMTYTEKMAVAIKDRRERSGK